MMKDLKNIIIFGVILLFANFIRLTTSIGLPDTILGMFILFVLLKTKVLKDRGGVGETADKLLLILPLTLVPTSAGIVESYHLIANNVLAFVFVSVAAAVLTLSVTGLVVKKLMEKIDD